MLASAVFAGDKAFGAFGVAAAHNSHIANARQAGKGGVVFVVFIAGRHTGFQMVRSPPHTPVADLGVKGDAAGSRQNKGLSVDGVPVGLAAAGMAHLPLYQQDRQIRTVCFQHSNRSLFFVLQDEIPCLLL